MKIIEQTPTKLILQSGFWFFITTTYIFDKQLMRLTIQRKNLFGSNETSEPLNEFSDAQIEVQVGENAQNSYRVALVRTDGKTLPLTLSYTMGRKDKDAAASAIRNILRS